MSKIIQHKGKWYFKTKTGHREILATTNPELKVNVEEGLVTFIESIQKPTDQFIQDWIKNGCPEFVNVEYEIDLEVQSKYDKEHQQEYTGIDTWEEFYKLKISKENTITCSFIEDDWRRFIPIIEERINRGSLRDSGFELHDVQVQAVASFINNLPKSHKKDE